MIEPWLCCDESQPRKGNKPAAGLLAGAAGVFHSLHSIDPIWQVWFQTAIADAAAEESISLSFMTACCCNFAIKHADRDF